MKTLDKQTLIKLLKIKSLDVYLNENLKNHTTFKLSNNSCKGLLVCNTETSLIKTLKILKCQHAFKSSSKTFKLNNFPLILGNGSNVVFKNDFYDDYIIKLGKHFSKIKFINADTIEVGANVNLFVLNKFCADNCLTGLEWSYGIPASVGGAVAMNAGAFNNEIGNFVKEVKILRDGKPVWITDFSFEYRNSSFKENKDIVLAVKLQLKRGKQNEIIALLKQFFDKRKLTQPQGFCAGSVFKQIRKPNEIIYPAKLIDNLGLKGVKIGDAEVSTKHSGFIVNNASATSNDVLNLIDLIKQKVKEAHNVNLETEIQIIE